MKLKVFITPRAREQIRGLNAYWRANREKAPKLLRNELRNTFALVSERPGAGWHVKDTRIDNLRTYPVKKTPYLVYYVHNIDKKRIEVLAVWSGMREYGPPFDRL